MHTTPWSMARLLIRNLRSSLAIDPTGERLAKSIALETRRRFFSRMWQPKHEVALEATSTEVERSSILFVIHVHYPDMLERALEFLRDLPLESDKIITTSSQEVADLSKSASVGVGHKTIVVPNRGRNFGPLLDVLSEHRDWEYLVHLHTKKSEQDIFGRGSKWNSALWSELGNPETAIDAVEILHHHAEYGVAYPDVSAFVSPLNFNWNRNAEAASELLAKLGFNLPEGPIAFPAGGMFAVKKGAILPLLALGLKSTDTPLEPVGVDGTMLHALERLIGVVPTLSGYKHLVIRGGRFYSDTSYTAGPRWLSRQPRAAETALIELR